MRAAGQYAHWPPLIKMAVVPKGIHIKYANVQNWTDEKTQH